MTLRELFKLQTETEIDYLAKHWQRLTRDELHRLCDRIKYDASYAIEKTQRTDDSEEWGMCR